MKYNKHARITYCSLLSLLGIVLNVSMAWAVELSVPIDYPTIQAAIDASTTGDSVIIEDGTYKENIAITTSLILRSRNGAQGVVIEPLDTSFDIIRVYKVDSLTISGLTLKGSTATGLHIHSSSNVKVIANTFSENYYGLHLEDTRDSLILENTMTRNEQGLNLYYSNGNKVEANVVNLNANSGILLHSSNNNEITGNTANKNVWNGITLSASNDNIVMANRLLNNTYAIVVSESAGNEISENTTMPRLYYVLPVALIYLAILLYGLERKAFLLYYKIKYGEESL